MTDKEVLGLEDKRFAAMVARDFSGLEALVHDQLRYTHSSGNTDGKATWLESMKAGRVKYKKANCREQKVQIYGDTALVTGRAHIEAEIGGHAKTPKLLFPNASTRTPHGSHILAR